MLENRAGMQLLELTVTIAVAGILIAGSSSAIFIAGQANEKAFAAAGIGSENAHVVNLVRSDLESAQHIAIHGNHVLIHNKNSDGGTEVIGYSWSGPGGALERTIQGSGQAITGSLDHAPLLWQTARHERPRCATRWVARDASGSDVPYRRSRRGSVKRFATALPFVGYRSQR